MDMVIRRTEDHSIFKHLKGNRTVTQGRVEKIKQSIKRVGYIMNPIIVNENYQIIDGQGREQALAELGLPVDFIVVEGTGITECRSMNIYQSNWKIEDYVWSYAEQGDPSYLRLYHLMKKYKKDGFDFKSISSVMRKGLGEIASRVVMDGGIVFSEEEKEEAIKCLEWIKTLMPVLETADSGSIKSYIQVLAWCYHNPNIDNAKLKERLEKRKVSITPAINSQQSAVVIENIYDYGTQYKSFLSLEYMKERNRDKRLRSAISKQEERNK